jgi:hypothetical protein
MKIVDRGLRKKKKDRPRLAVEMFSSFIHPQRQRSLCIFVGTSLQASLIYTTLCFLEEIRSTTLVKVTAVAAAAVVEERQGPMSIPPSYTRHSG